MNTFSRIALGLGVTAVATGAAVGVGTLAQADDASTTPKPAASASSTPGTSAGAGQNDQNAQGRTGQPGQGGHHGMRGQQGGPMVDELASKLGLDADTVRSAVQKAREATKPAKPADGTKPSEADRTAHEQAFAKALAKELGVDEAKVSQALTEIRDAHRAQAQAGLKDRLAQAVKDGKLTQAEADAVAKAVDAGVIGGGMGGHGHR